MVVANEAAQQRTNRKIYTCKKARYLHFDTALDTLAAYTPDCCCLHPLILLSIAPPIVLLTPAYRFIASAGPRSKGRPVTMLLLSVTLRCQLSFFSQPPAPPAPAIINRDAPRHLQRATQGTFSRAHHATRLQRTSSLASGFLIDSSGEAKQNHKSSLVPFASPPPANREHVPPTLSRIV